ncbi:hypothetical protein CO725_01040 [Vibrio parahaemolyticus]|uniref:hypothetical protein n=1 Tax=Vibrio parahaemolyticus TaxID=670 RepID=UPI000BE3CF44|nr:hypothetical protein [Vibrio parahaemolyticus]ATI44272.1 hypothetical protein CO725_01040 [Vibrio parahaemolyticus]
MKKLILIGLCIYSTVSFSKPNIEYNKTTKQVQNGFQYETTQTIHHQNQIWYLKKSYKIKDLKTGALKTLVDYFCFNGYPYNPYVNLNQSWTVTDKNLTNCKRVKEELEKNSNSK